MSTSKYESHFCLSTVRCEVLMLSVLVDQVLRRCCLYVVLSQLEKARSFLGVYRIGEVSQVKNLL